MSEPHRIVMTQFPPNVEAYLRQVDKICQGAAQKIADETLVGKIQDPNGTPELDEEDKVFMYLVNGFGIMFNKLIEVGVLRDDVLIQPGPPGSAKS